MRFILFHLRGPSTKFIFPTFIFGRKFGWPPRGIHCLIFHLRTTRSIGKRITDSESVKQGLSIYFLEFALLQKSIESIFGVYERNTSRVIHCLDFWAFALVQKSIESIFGVYGRDTGNNPPVRNTVYFGNGFTENR